MMGTQLDTRCQGCCKVEANFGNPFGGDSKMRPPVLRLPRHFTRQSFMDEFMSVLLQSI
jgi:hypothetical protein